MREDILEDLNRIRIWSGYDLLPSDEQRASGKSNEYATRPQPITYDLTRYDFCRHGDRYPDLDDGLTYADEPSDAWLFLRILGIAAIVYGGYFAWLWRVKAVNMQNGLTGILVAFWVAFHGSAIVLNLIEKFRRKRPKPEFVRYKEALKKHWLYRVAAYETGQAFLRQQRSYWEGLSGYEFERATAEVLKLYQFNPRVTKGSGDGGVDIDVVRAGKVGVVQCKAHAACVGPHTVRDLYGVIHHSEAHFGMIVSRGGFTSGAAEFARNKPIFLLDTSHLIAMQEGQDVLAAAFD